jgi:ketosteroid isomerase-like protein
MRGVRQRPWGVCVLAATAALALGACGGDDDEGGDEPAAPPTTAAPTTTQAQPSGGSDEQAIRKTIADYLRATARGDGQAACAHLTENAKRIAAEAPGTKADTCEGVIAEIATKFSPSEKAKLNNVPQGQIDVKVTGATATVQLQGRNRTTKMVKRGDRWLIEGFVETPQDEGDEQEPDVKEVPFDEVEERLEAALDRRYDMYRYECPSTAPQMKVGETRECEITADGDEGTAELELAKGGFLQIRISVGGRQSFSQSQVQP